MSFLADIGRPNDLARVPVNSFGRFAPPIGSAAFNGSFPSVPNFGFPNAMAVEDAGARNFGTGVTTSNFAPIVASFIQKFSRRFPGGSCLSSNMLVFVERTITSPMLGLKIEFEIGSVFELNCYGISEEGRRRHGVNATAESWNESFAFAGSYNASIAPHVTNAGGTEAAVIVGRLARIFDIGRAFRPRNADTSSNELDHLYFLDIRRNLDLDDSATLKPKPRVAASRPPSALPSRRSSASGSRRSSHAPATSGPLSNRNPEMPDEEYNDLPANPPGFATENDLVTHEVSRYNQVPFEMEREAGPAAADAAEAGQRRDMYWNKYIHVGASAPPPWLYIDDESIGSSRRAGTIARFDESNRATLQSTKCARLSLDGRHNTLRKERDYVNQVVLLPTVDLLVNA